jgi:hypothetical protein
LKLDGVTVRSFCVLYESIEFRAQFLNWKLET